VARLLLLLMLLLMLLLLLLSLSFCFTPLTSAVAAAASPADVLSAPTAFAAGDCTGNSFCCCCWLAAVVGLADTTFSLSFSFSCCSAPSCCFCGDADPNGTCLARSRNVAGFRPSLKNGTPTPVGDDRPAAALVVVVVGRLSDAGVRVAGEAECKSEGLGCGAGVVMVEGVVMVDGGWRTAGDAFGVAATNDTDDDAG
jgi:hypothetical protein